MALGILGVMAALAVLISAVPSNDWLGKILGIALIVLTAAASAVRRSNFRAARWMLTVMLIAAPLLLYWS